MHRPFLALLLLAALTTGCDDAARGDVAEEGIDSGVGASPRGSASESPPPECEVGAKCGYECVDEAEAWCHLCGGLTLDERCDCVPDYCGAIAECDESGPAQEGEFCGTQWWCDRACDDGLECLRFDPCADAVLPAGMLVDDWRRVCRAGQSEVCDIGQFM